MSSNNSNKLLINYHDVCIYQSDLNILTSPTSWLNDTCINFHMNRISNETYNVDQSNLLMNISGNNKLDMMVKDQNDEQPKTKYIFPSVIYVDPLIVSFFMHQLSIEEDMDELLGLYQSWDSKPDDDSLLPGTASYSVLMFPINDSHGGSYTTFQSIGGGNHWSLLVVVTTQLDAQQSSVLDHPETYYFHLDSCKGYNLTIASTVSQRINLIFNLGQNNTKSAKSDINNVIECDIPQQQNGHDCGICVLAAIESLSKF